MAAKVLVIDDDRNLVKVVEYNLREEGHEVVTAVSAEAGLEVLGRERVDLVLTDVRMGGMDGMELLGRVREQWPDLPVILVTAFAAIDSAVEAIKAGAVDYLPKPFNKDDLKYKVRKALAHARLREENQRLRLELARRSGLDNIIGRSEAMRKVFALVTQAAPTDASVLINGASGTGKELIARALHDLSLRREGPWVPVNCAAIPRELLESDLFGHVRGAFTGAVRDQPGKFELAHQGSLFLDEIGDLDLALQPKLLRALQEHEIQPIGGPRPIKVNVRLITATKLDLRERVAQGLFREDLYFRLNVIPIELPPLAHRRGDLALLADHFLQKYARGRLKLSPEAAAALERYAWPGNVRELENVIERMAVLHSGPSGLIESADLPPEIAAGPDASPLEGRTLRGAEKELVERALAQAHGNRSQAARLLGVPRHVLLYRLKKYGIE